MNIQVGSKEHVSAYIEVLHRLGKVKGYSQKYEEDNEDVDWYKKELSYNLEGNSNDIDFAAYDKQEALKAKEKDPDRIKAAEGILRIEVRLMKPKSIKKFTCETDTSKQIKDLSKHSKEIFLKIFTQIVPTGDLFKKQDAIKIIEENITKKKQQEKMLRLLELIPKKRSLLLAQKEINDRGMDKVMRGFAKLNLSPVTVGKRAKIKCLKNLYDYLLE